MCGFAPGDEVVCVSKGNHPDWRFVAVGETYTVGTVYPPDEDCPDWGIDLVEVPVDATVEFDFQAGEIWIATGFDARHFRKVQRRDLTEWLSTATDFEEPKRAPAKRRERA